MGAVVDIRCPDCERARTVMKVGIDCYRCTDCEREFSHEDVLP